MTAALGRTVLEIPRSTLTGLVRTAVQARAVTTPEGVLLEQLERDPARFLPDVADDLSTDVVRVDLARPADPGPPGPADRLPPLTPIRVT